MSTTSCASPCEPVLPPDLSIRRAALPDLDFLVAADLKNEGYHPDPAEPAVSTWGAEQLQSHRAKIAAFVQEPSEAGWVVEDSLAGRLTGMVLARFRDRQHEPPSEANLFLFRLLDPGLFPADGRFCEVFNLWVHPDYRRKGLATRLKLEMEKEARRRGMSMIYTHTEAANPHVVELNLRLGYRVVRTGPIWDSVPRVSLVKDI